MTGRAPPAGESLPAEVGALLRSWELEADGPLITTRSSWVLPVRGASSPAMLKVARIPDERCGYGLMRWWNGQGAAKVFASQPGALLLERAEEGWNLSAMAGEARTTRPAASFARRPHGCMPDERAPSRTCMRSTTGSGRCSIWPISIRG